MCLFSNSAKKKRRPSITTLNKGQGGGWAVPLNRFGERKQYKERRRSKPRTPSLSCSAAPSLLETLLPAHGHRAFLSHGWRVRRMRGLAARLSLASSLQIVGHRAQGDPSPECVPKTSSVSPGVSSVCYHPGDQRFFSFKPYNWTQCLFFQKGLWEVNREST